VNKFFISFSCRALLLAVVLAIPRIGAASVDASVGNGKKVLYVHNQTKLERARAAVPAPDAKRIAALEAWRKSDDHAMAYLTSLGFVVAKANESTPLDAARGQDLIIISETVDAVDVSQNYRYLAIPLLTCENDLLGELGMTGLKNGRDYGTEEEQRFMWLVNAPHPLAAGLTAGIQNVLDDEHCKMNWGKPGLGAATIATIRGDPEKATIFSYERGATMNGEFLAPARRVSFFLWQDTFDHLRPEGLALFRAAVLWAVTKPQ
jgi:hypothetical protein